MQNSCDELSSDNKRKNNKRASCSSRHSPAESLSIMSHLANFITALPFIWLNGRGSDYFWFFHDCRGLIPWPWCDSQQCIRLLPFRSQSADFMENYIHDFNPRFGPPQFILPLVIYTHVWEQYQLTIVATLFDGLAWKRTGAREYAVFVRLIQSHNYSIHAPSQ